MTSPNVIIQDRTTGDKQFKVLTHLLWDNFTESLRSFAPQRPLVTLLTEQNVGFPQGNPFP